MKVRDLLIAIGILGLIGGKILYHPTFPSIANDYLATYSAGDSSNPKSFLNPCDNRNNCVYLYLAPWCPHCRDFLQNIPNFRNSWKSAGRPGLKIIVGNDKKDAINAMAAQIGSPVYLDYHDKFLHAVHVNSFPFILIVDSNQRIMAFGSQEGIDWINKEINTHMNK